MTEQTCAECGSRAEPGQSFCDACGAVLSWRSVPAAAPRSAEEPGEPADTVEPAGRDEPADTVEPGAAATEPLPSVPAPAPEPAPAPAPAPAADSATERARHLLVPVLSPDPAPAPPDVAPVLPGRPVADRPDVRAPGTQPGAEGGVPCPWCATPNRTDRHFCCRCAMPMAGKDTQPEARRPWWRRMLDFRNKEVPWAGDRPRVRRGLGRLLTWVVAALVIALVVTAALGAGPAIQAVKDHFAPRYAVAPDQVSASQWAAGHGPKLAFDEISNTWWGPGVSQAGTGAWIQANFNQPTNLLNVIITPGVSTHADQLSQEAAPATIEAQVTTEGKTVNQTLTLNQGASAQVKDFRFNGVTQVRFILQTAYGQADNKQVAIAEIEFRGPAAGKSV